MIYQTNDRKIWFLKGGTFADSKVEMSPKGNEDMCVAQYRHLKPEKVIYLEQCLTARQDKTLFWSRY
jgi:hypothetical protein